MTYSGIVQRGAGKGKELGYPTANIPFTDEGVAGIYAATATVGGGEYHAAVFIDERRKLLEAHLLNFNDELYGLELRVTLNKKLREAERFSDEKTLKAAITADIEAVRAHFTTRR